MKLNRSFSKRMSVAFCSLFTVLLALPAAARVTTPVAMSINAMDEIKPNSPATVIVVLEALQDVPAAYMKLAVPESSWVLNEGSPYWSGTMRAGEVVKLTLTLVPKVANPEPVRGSVEAPGWEPTQSMLTRAPLKPEPEQGPSASKGSRPAERSATANVIATGQCFYTENEPVGLRFAKVELRDDDSGEFKADDFCGSGMTNVNGYFQISGSCGDPFRDLPDYFATIVMNNNTLEIKPNDFFAGTYTWRRGYKENFPGGNLDFGSLDLGSATHTGRNVLHIHNLIMQAWEYMAGLGEGVPKVLVEYPAASLAYIPGTWPLVSRIYIPQDFEDGQVLEMFANHVWYSIVRTSADSGTIQSWARFHSAAMLQAFGRPLGSYNVETHQDNYGNDLAPNILWDLFDSGDDDQHGEGAGARDAVSIPFNVLWDVVRHPLSYSGQYGFETFLQHLWQKQPALKNLVIEVCREHHRMYPLPDLLVSAPAVSQTAVTPGGQLTLTPSTVSNITPGTTWGRPFTVRYRLSGPTLVTLVDFGVSPVYSSGNSTIQALYGTPQITVPESTPEGTYYLETCADVTGQVPEENENNNCAKTASPITVRYLRYPVTLQTVNGRYLTAVGGGGLIDDVIHSDATAVGDWERFTLVQLATGQCAVRTVNGRYLTAMGGGGRIYDVIHSDATAINAWEKFALSPLGGGKYGVQTLNGNYLTAVGGGGRLDDVIHSDATAIGSWETFTIGGLPSGACQK
ncbi:MAG: hypothetical protein HY820_43795 [Acidobacteria bacterium]|nr:hypothetical protein [Acidobacteriota bacterium]